MSMSNKTYDILKWVAMVFLPALGTLQRRTGLEKYALSYIDRS